MDESRLQRIVFFLKNVSWSSYFFTAWFLVMALAVSVAFTARVLAPRVIQNMAVTYTDERPKPVRVVDVPEERREAVEARVEAFIEEEGRPEALVLTEEELNGLLQGTSDMGEGKPFVYLSLGNGIVTADVSLLLEEDIPIGPWSAGVKGRYLNGKAELRVRAENETLTFDLLSFRVAGRDLPSWVVDLLQDELREKTSLDSDDVAELARQVGTIEVLPGRIILHPQ